MDTSEQNWMGDVWTITDHLQEINSILLDREEGGTVSLNGDSLESLWYHLDVALEKAEINYE